MALDWNNEYVKNYIRKEVEKSVRLIQFTGKINDNHSIMRRV